MSWARRSRAWVIVAALTAITSCGGDAAEAQRDATTSTAAADGVSERGEPTSSADAATTTTEAAARSGADLDIDWASIEADWSARYCPVGNTLYGSEPSSVATPEVEEVLLFAYGLRPSLEALRCTWNSAVHISLYDYGDEATAQRFFNDQHVEPDPHNSDRGTNWIASEYSAAGTAGRWLVDIGPEGGATFPPRSAMIDAVTELVALVEGQESPVSDLRFRKRVDPASLEGLLEDYWDAYATCRGGSGDDDATLASCDLEVAYSTELATQGMCFGTAGLDWAPCEDARDDVWFDGMCPDTDDGFGIVVNRERCDSATRLVSNAADVGDTATAFGEYTCISFEGSYGPTIACGDGTSSPHGVYAVVWRTP